GQVGSALRRDLEIARKETRSAASRDTADRSQLGRELQGYWPSPGSVAAARRGVPDGENKPHPWLGRPSVARWLCESRQNGRSRETRDGIARRRSEAASQGQPPTGWNVSSVRLLMATSERLHRCRTASPRVPDHLRKDNARRLAHVPHEVAAWGRVAGP